MSPLQHTVHYVKFSQHRFDEDSVTEAEAQSLNTLRSFLRQHDLLGERMAELEAGAPLQLIGFGNVSLRRGETEAFIISGTNTGGRETLTAGEYVLVESVDVERNSLVCRGHINASAESMSHAAVYAALPSVRCVAHVHSEDLWKKAARTLPMTPEAAAYGTPDIARAIDIVCRHQGVCPGLLAMGGHLPGFMFYAESGAGVIELVRETLERLT